MTIEVDLIDDGYMQGPRAHPEYYIAGVVSAEGEPQRREVRIYNVEQGRQRVSGTFSRSDTGAYTLRDIPPGEYIVIALDHTRTYNAAVADAVVAVPMDE